MKDAAGEEVVLICEYTGKKQDCHSLHIQNVEKVTFSEVKHGLVPVLR